MEELIKLDLRSSPKIVFTSLGKIMLHYLLINDYVALDKKTRKKFIDTLAIFLSEVEFNWGNFLPCPFVFFIYSDLLLL